MPAQKASRNKTLDTPLSEGQRYLDRCLTPDRLPQPPQPLQDRTILGEMEQVCPRLVPGCADLIVADPPYNLTKKFDQTTFTRKSRADYEAYTRRWLTAMEPLLRPGGTIYVCCDWQSSLVVGSLLGEFFTVRNRITWQREKGRGARANWKNGMEDIWFATKGEDYVFHLDAVRQRRRVMAPYRVDGRPKDWTEGEGGNYRDTCPSNFWDDITIPFWSMAENTAHPTQKPEKLIAKLVLASSSPGDLVLDPFLGSGTTSVVAKKLGRHYLGIEREPQYCLWAEQRLERAGTDPAIQGYADGVFWERHSLEAQQTARRRQKE